MLQLLPDDSQREIIDAVQGFASEELPLSRFRSGDKVPGELDRWSEIINLGYITLALPEADGGAGMGLAEEVLVYRELGRVLISPGAVATTIAAHLLGMEGRGAELEGMVSGTLRAAPAVAVEGSDLLIFDGDGADLLLLRKDETLYLLPRTALGNVRSAPSLDESLGLEVASASLDKALLKNEEGWLLLRYHLLIAAMQVGISEAARDMAVSYAKERVQFGKPIGAFQAIKHDCADMAVASEMAYCQLLYATIMARDATDGAAFHVRAASLLAGRAARQNAACSIQVHGGIGFTAEFDAHRFVKRALVLSQMSGNDGEHQAALLDQDFPC